MRGNGFGHLRDTRRDMMQKFDELPASVRRFVAAADVKLSMKHLVKRLRSWEARGRPPEEFIAKEQRRLERLTRAATEPMRK